LESGTTEIEKSIDPEVLGTEGFEIGKFILTNSFLIFVFSIFVISVFEEFHFLI